MGSCSRGGREKETLRHTAAKPRRAGRCVWAMEIMEGGGCESALSAELPASEMESEAENVDREGLEVLAVMVLVARDLRDL